MPPLTTWLIWMKCVVLLIPNMDMDYQQPKVKEGRHWSNLKKNKKFKPNNHKNNMYS